jgi:regulator of RNase E activity RraA
MNDERRTTNDERGPTSRPLTLTVPFGECSIGPADTVVPDASGRVRIAAQHSAAVLEAAPRTADTETEPLDVK